MSASINGLNMYACPEFVSERHASDCDSELPANTPTEGPKARRVWPRREKSSGVDVILSISNQLTHPPSPSLAPPFKRGF